MPNTEYHKQLVIKLRALIAVLQVAIKKVRMTINIEQSSEKCAKLKKVMSNLDKTLLISQRALFTLDDTEFCSQLNEYCKRQ